MMTHPALVPGAVAVITGAASGIGLAAAKRFVGLGLRVCIADIAGERLEHAAAEVAAVAPGGSADVMAAAADVARAADLQAMEAAVRERFGGTDVLMNNAGIGPASSVFGPADSWSNILAVNLWGAIHGVQAFVPAMIERGRPGLVINTG